MPKAAIQLHENELQGIDIDIKPIRVLSKIWETPHRDDHYMFVIQQKGSFSWELDFREVILTGPAVCYVSPGQVHRYLNYEQSEGWLFFVDNGLMATRYREIFDTYLNVVQAAGIAPKDPMFAMVPVLEDIFNNKENPLRKTLIRSITETITGMIASRMVQVQASTSLISSQKYTIVTNFKQLIKARCKECKQVKAYASLLNITPLYLNEAVKEVTGFPASYWIHQEIILEAKRLLCYSTLDIREIAYQLGYEDHAYFSRFFKKNTGTAASIFRNKNHHLSNHSH